MSDFAGLGFGRLGHPKTTARFFFAFFLEEGLILLKAFRAECHVAPIERIEARRAEAKGPQV